MGRRRRWRSASAAAAARRSARLGRGRAGRGLGREGRALEGAPAVGGGLCVLAALRALRGDGVVGGVEGDEDVVGGLGGPLRLEALEGDAVGGLLGLLPELEGVADAGLGVLEVALVVRGVLLVVLAYAGDRP